jgi:hypothetical protein
MPKDKSKKTRTKSKKTKKKLEDFLVSEEGRIRKKDLAKLGVSLATLATMFQETPEVGAQTVHSNFNPHNSGFGYDISTPGEGHHSVLGHNNVTAHGSHGSHGSHGQW